MSNDGLTLEQFTLLQEIANKGDKGHPMPKHDRTANGLAVLRFIVCRRSDSSTETWWATYEGRQQVLQR